MTLAHELTLGIADAIARVASEYEIEIGPRGMVKLSVEVHDAVIEWIGDEATNEQFEDEFYSEDVARAVSDEDDSYDQGYHDGLEFSQKTPIEIWDAAKSHLEGLHGGYFYEGFRDGLAAGGVE